MKFVAVAVTALFLITVPAWAEGSLQQLTQEPAHAKQVAVTITVAQVTETADLRSDILLVWNRAQRTTPIGHAVKSCVKVGQGGFLGGGILNCNLVMSLPLGKVTASGLIHNLNRYTLVITGGTGPYERASGPLSVMRSGDGLRRLTFSV